MFSKKFDDYNVLLASRSKRRHELLKQMGVKFKIIDQSIDESFPNSLKENNITEYLAKKKSIPIVNKLKTKNLLITYNKIISHKHNYLSKTNPKNKPLLNTNTINNLQLKHI